MRNAVAVAVQKQHQQPTMKSKLKILMVKFWYNPCPLQLPSLKTLEVVMLSQK